jgi:acyl-CoA reductase-like NAD-dependent aldehyde dehydrogenase
MIVVRLAAPGPGPGPGRRGLDARGAPAGEQVPHRPWRQKIVGTLHSLSIEQSIEKSGSGMAELEICAPDDQTVVETVAVDDIATVNAKVSAAARAMSRWAAMSPMQRAEALIQIAAATRAQLPSSPGCCPRNRARRSRRRSANWTGTPVQFAQYAGLATAVGRRHQQLGPGVSGHLERVPVGVVVGIVPWNFPASLFGSKVAPALAAGCAFLIKPAETTSAVTQRLAAIVQQFVPPGLVDVVIGGPDVGQMLVSHPDVARVAFTGSTAVGRRIAASAGEGLKRASLELGGCDPFVVLEDADVPLAMRCLIGSRFYNAGQVCVAPKRLVVHERVADEAVALLESKIRRIVPGPGLDPAALATGAGWPGRGALMNPVTGSANPEDVAATVAFLCSRAAGYVSGQVL